MTPLRGAHVLEVGDRIGIGLLGGLLAQLGADVSVLTPTPVVRQNKWRNPAAALFGKVPIGGSQLAARLRDADIVLASTDIAPLPVWDRTPRQIVCDITAHAPASPRRGRSPDRSCRWLRPA